jgi:hypothetical protein
MGCGAARAIKAVNKGGVLCRRFAIFGGLGELLKQG